METFDFGIGWRIENDDEELFIKALKAECEARRLKFIYIHTKSLSPLVNKIKKGEFRLKFYLDMASETHDSKDDFTQFTYALKDSGTRVVADPDDVKAASDKSITHFDLARDNIPVPFTILIRNWEPTRKLTEEEKEQLGFPFVIKPALGYAREGVKIINSKWTLKEIAEARKYDPGDNFLLQEFIEPKELGGEPAWFRIFHLFGEIIPCWWNPETHIYRQVTLKEMDEFKLLPLTRITTEIARVTKIDWFSCEIAVSKKNGKFIVIDYMNDQCSIVPQSKYKDGVPDDLVAHITGRMVEKAWQYIQGRFTLTHRAIWLPKIQVKDQNV
ncbi:MAG: hypothetical protein JW788_00765 [Candidatus Omnitrophica bacterium]|nr:hypothetical protein [Candidatus Omnitrophota bacterium]